MILPVLKYPDPRLREKCVELAAVTPEVRTLVDDMIETMYARNGIGLAATQIGKSIRLIVVDVSGPDERTDCMVLINPTLELIGAEVEGEEGCLSVSELNAPVVRSNRVKVNALDLDGKSVSFEAEGMKAVCLQHECDHLDGTLFIDRISRLKRMMYDRKIEKKKKKP